MVFAGLSDKLQGIFQKLKGKGTVNEADVTAAMREIKVALLEADVNFKVVKDFIARIKERAVGSDVLKSLTPGQQIIKIVHEELTELLGGTQTKLVLASQPPTIVMMVGLQGSGKTTSAAKMGLMLKKQGRRPLLVAGDVYRPAAVKQIQVLGEQLDLPVFTMGTQVSPVDIAKAAVEYALNHGRDVVIIDTAGRLHINEELMDELKAIKKVAKPHEILLVIDAMTGQDAVNVAESFHRELGIDGIVMTKLDGDTRGGAALSVKAVTGRPIKLTGVGEKLDALELFFPDRMASRILGMGDVLTLIEKAQANIDVEKALEMQKKLKTQDFTLADFLEQMQQMKNMGPLEQVLGMIPGLGGKQLKELKAQIDEKEMVRMEAIIQSMTSAERANPHMIDGSRRKRIALGSGTKVQDVNRLLKQFEQTRKMMKQFAQMGKSMKKPGVKLPFMR